MNTRSQTTVFPVLIGCKAAAIPVLLGGEAERLRALHAIDGTEEEEEAVGDWQNRLLRQRAVAWGSKMAERDDDGPVAERGPGAAYAAFVLMEELLDKLKLLSYEEEALRRHNVRPLSRCLSSAPSGTGRLWGLSGSGRRRAVAFMGTDCGLTLWAAFSLGPVKCGSTPPYSTQFDPK